MVVVAFLGLGVATSEGAHLRPRFADGLIPPKYDTHFNRLADVITACFYGFVAYVAVFVVQETYELEDVTPTLRILIWPFQSVIIIAFGIGAVRHLIFAAFPPLRPLESSAEASDDQEVSGQ
jgi:C4-dicarboxylate transporter DctQ subunit